MFIWYSTILYYTVLHCTTLYYTILHCTTLNYTVLHYTIHYTTLYYTLYYTILHPVLHCTHTVNKNHSLVNRNKPKIMISTRMSSVNTFAILNHSTEQLFRTVYSEHLYSNSSLGCVGASNTLEKCASEKSFNDFLLEK